MTSTVRGVFRGWPLFMAVVILVLADSFIEGSIGTGSDVMTNHWHVHLKGDLGKETAMTVAKRNGFSYVSPVSESCSWQADTL